MEFTTNIHCSSCVRAVSGALNSEKRIVRWQVDTEHPEKILRVEGTDDPVVVISAVERAGFEARLRSAESAAKG
jgi:copper chaperone